MPVHDLTYQHWSGMRRERSPVWVLARAELRTLLARRSVRVLLILGLGFVLVWVAMIYVESHALRSGPLARLAGVLEVDAASFRTFMVRQRLLHLLLFLAVADLVALDRRHRALQIYLSRPLGRQDYVLGKLVAIAALASVMTWIPALVLVATKTILRGEVAWLGAFPWLPASALAYALCLIVPLGLLTLALSSLARGGRQASAALFGTLALSGAAGQALAALTRQDAWQLLSMNACLDRVASTLFGTATQSDLPAWAAFATLGAVAVLAALVLRARVRAIDVVGGA
jgi:ABC-2 type transport system permease protein